MTDNLPAVRAHADLAVPMRQDTDSWVRIVDNVAALATQIADTEFVPKDMRRKPAAVAAAILYGREVGLPPMTALTQTHVIEGKPAMSAEAMRAMVLAAGHEIRVEASTGALCRMYGRRRGSAEWSAPVEWTIDAARTAGLTGKSNWKAYPRQMLQARATAELCRLIFPDVIHGFSAVEEFDAGGESVEEPAHATTTVARGVAAKTSGRRTRKAVAGPGAGPQQLTSGTPEVPLPGEPGFDDPTQEPERQPHPQGEAEDEPPGSVAVSPPDSEPVVVEAEGVEVSGDAEEGEPSDAPASEPEDVVSEGVDSPSGTTPDEEDPSRPSSKQQGMYFALFRDLGLTGEPSRDERLRITGQILGRDVESTSDLTRDDMKALLDTLARAKSMPQLVKLLESEFPPDRTPPLPRPMSRPQGRMLSALWVRLGISAPEQGQERAAMCKAVAGRELAAVADLTYEEAQRLLDLTAGALSLPAAWDAIDGAES